MDCREYDLRSLNSSKADADDATLIERVELAASYPIAFPKGMSGITKALGSLYNPVRNYPIGASGIFGRRWRVFQFLQINHHHPPFS